MPSGPPPGPAPNPHPRRVRRAFRERLADLDGQFVDAARAVADRVTDLSLRAMDGDGSALDVARSLSIDTGLQAESLHEDIYVLLALEAPVAGDLRRVVALLRVVRAADRAASLLRHGCEVLLDADGAGIDPSLASTVRDLVTQSARVFDLGIAAWTDPGDVATEDVVEADDTVDALQGALVDGLAEGSPTRRQALGTTLLARYYERIGDHGVSIARDAAFVATGERPSKHASGT